MEKQNVYMAKMKGINNQITLYDVFCQLFNENFGKNNECKCQTDNQSKW